VEERGEKRRGGTLIDAMADFRKSRRRRLGGIWIMRENDRTYGLCRYSDFPGRQRSWNREGGAVVERLRTIGRLIT